MTDDRVLDDARLIAEGAVVLVNIFTPPPGGADAFIAAQIDEYRRLKGRVDGALGNRLLRAHSGERVVNIAYFRDAPSYRAWRESALFADHLDRIRHLVLRVEPDLYAEVYVAALDTD